MPINTMVPIILITLLISCFGSIDHHINHFPSSNAIIGNYSQAAVVADNGICSDLGKRILLRGGNAIDAMIATVLCLGVVDPQNVGIGGSIIVTIYNKYSLKNGPGNSDLHSRSTNSCFAIDGRNRAPFAAKWDMFLNKTGASQKGWLAVGVPGSIHGLYTAYKIAGSKKIPWKDIVQPVADLCRFGFRVSRPLAKTIIDLQMDIMEEASLREIFFNNRTGRLYGEGDTMRRPELSSTLHELANADDPIAWFYNSSRTLDMVREFQENGGIISLEDFQQYKSKYGSDRPVITMNLDSDMIVCGPPPPSSASVTMAILNILQGFNLNHNMENITAQVDTYHKLLESMKFANAARMKLGDMDFVRNALEMARNITSPEYGDSMRRKIKSNPHADVKYYTNGQDATAANNHGTSHICVIDGNGNAVSVTTTINYYFGARVRSKIMDIIWNDEMDDFATPCVPNYYGYVPSHANIIKPGKRPISSFSPLIIYNSTSGDVKLIIGAAGGSRIITATAQVIMQLLWFQQNLKQAIEWPRLHNQLQPFQSEFEGGFPEALLQKLLERGHNFTSQRTLTAEMLVVTAIHKNDNGRIYAASDPRKHGGYPAGY